MFDHVVEDEPLFRLLHATLQELRPNELINDFLFCPLPLSAYHITVWDGINEGNLENLNDQHKPYFREFIQGVSSTSDLAEPFQGLLNSSPLLNRKIWNIRLQFKELILWADSPVLVATFEAADEDSKVNLQELEEERAKLYQSFEPLLGIKMYRQFVPHNTLGYFANREGALKALEQLERWNGVFKRSLKDSSILCTSVSLYGFDDMTHFFKIPRPDKIKYLPGATKDLATIQRLMNMHDFYRTIPDFYLGHLNREALDLMRSGTYMPNPEKTKRLQDSFHTSLILKLDNLDRAVEFQSCRRVFEELQNLILEFFPKAEPEIYFEAAHITIRSLVQYRQQSVEELNRYRDILCPHVKKWLARFTQDTTLYVKGLHVSLNSFKGLSVGVRVYPSTPMIQTLRGVAGKVLYDALDGGSLDQKDLWTENHAATWHTKLTHATLLRERSREFLQPWDASNPPEKTKAFLDSFERLVNQYENQVLAKITHIGLEDLYLRNGKSDKMLAGEEGGIEIPMA